MRKKLSSVEQELAVSRALSALCGGSGVGQAPELPYSAENREQRTENRGQSFQDPKILRFQVKENAVFLPKAPQLKFEIRSTKFETNLKIQNLKQEESKNESKIQDKTRGNVKEKVEESRDQESRIKNQELRIGREKSNFRKVTRSFLIFASILLILISVVGFIFTFGPILQAEIRYKFTKNTTQKSLDSRLRGNDKVGGGQSSKKDKKPLILPITAMGEVGKINFPASSSIVIPKIDAKSEFFVNTDAANYDEYSSVLQKGIAHAKGTAIPGEVGNSYFFAHSAGNLFDVARFNAVFYLISKLEKGDSIYVSFGNQKFKYTVYDKKEVDPADTEYLNNRKDNGRMLTLQTCTPPGTDWRRLLVFAKIDF